MGYNCVFSGVNRLLTFCTVGTPGVGSHANLFLESLQVRGICLSNRIA
jgi:hypothetical protein